MCIFKGKVNRNVRNTIFVQKKIAVVIWTFYCILKINLDNMLSCDKIVNRFEYQKALNALSRDPFSSRERKSPAESFLEFRWQSNFPRELQF